MSLPSYIINFDELKDLLNEALSNTVVKDISDLYGVQKVKGFYQSVPAIVSEYKVADFTPEEAIIITGISYSQSAWKPNDYWELWIGQDRLFENVYTKEIGEQKHWEVVNPVKVGEPISVILNNQSGNSRHVWVDIEYVKLSDIIATPENKRFNKNVVKTT